MSWATRAGVRAAALGAACGSRCDTSGTCDYRGPLWRPALPAAVRCLSPLPVARSAVGARPGAGPKVGWQGARTSARRRDVTGGRRCPGRVRRRMERSGEPRRGRRYRGAGERQGRALQGKARQDKAKQGWAGLGWARCGGQRDGVLVPAAAPLRRRGCPGAALGPSEAPWDGRTGMASGEDPPQVRTVLGPSVTAASSRSSVGFGLPGPLCSFPSRPEASSSQRR